MSTSCKSLADWVGKVARHTEAERVHWCDGTEAEYDGLVAGMLSDGTLHELDQTRWPGCYLHRSDPNDVARVEHVTFICTPDEADAGPNNNWMAPGQAHRLIDGLFAGCMRGRTLYVIPYCMGPIDSPFSRCGVEITDSPYVVANMRIMTRMGAAALARIEKENSFVKGLHSIGNLDPDKRYIMHFPQELSIKSINSGYGGNALLGKKCHALRIASYQGRHEGWLAEHMLIIGLQDPTGRIRYVAAAFPSQCGKTNLAMLVPPEQFEDWRVWTLGDDIAWLHPGDDGRLYAINPEAGFFGVVPGTGYETNPNAYKMIRRNTIFTNVGLTAKNRPWWEGRLESEPALDWKGEPMSKGPAAHPNSRFTVSARQNSGYSPLMDDPRGVPIDAIVFGGRRRELAPLVYQARDWSHGVLTGAGVASETTAAAAGEVGVVRRDPMAMKPFCGYNFADYWAHWLQTGKGLAHAPAVFHVNWFRRDKDGQFLWPGFGDNMRVLKWILDRCEGADNAVETPIGLLPAAGSVDIDGLAVSEQDMQALLEVDRAGWREEMKNIGDYFDTYGERLPGELRDEHRRIVEALE